MHCTSTINRSCICTLTEKRNTSCQTISAKCFWRPAFWYLCVQCHITVTHWKLLDKFSGNSNGTLRYSLHIIFSRKYTYSAWKYNIGNWCSFSSTGTARARRGAGLECMIPAHPSWGKEGGSLTCQWSLLVNISLLEDARVGSCWCQGGLVLLSQGWCQWEQACHSPP